jgi:hypothetical protein
MNPEHITYIMKYKRLSLLWDRKLAFWFSEQTEAYSLYQSETPVIHLNCYGEHSYFGQQLLWSINLYSKYSTGSFRRHIINGNDEVMEQTAHFIADDYKYIFNTTFAVEYEYGPDAKLKKLKRNQFYIDLWEREISDFMYKSGKNN